MKIGILTFHRAINAGAVLQAYALQETLCSLGYDARIVDYNPSYVTNAYLPIRSLNILHPMGCFYEILSSYSRKKRIKKYLEFSNRYLKIFPLKQVKSLDAVVLGSDQIWNPHITGGSFDKVFFNASSDIKIPRAIAYAASTMSTGRLTEKDISELGQYLPGLTAIGVREKGLGDFINTNYDVKSTLVLDPTLIAPKDLFQKMALSSTPFVKEDYLLFYEVWHNSSVEKKARQLANMKGLKFIGLSGADIRMPSKGVRQVYSPLEFVSLIANASHIVTSSFHGTAFSLIFEKQFNVVCEEPHQAVRMQELLSIIGRNDLLSYKLNDSSDIPIDYTIVNAILENHRHQSISFLHENINRHPGI